FAQQDPAPTTGNINGIAVFIRFADESEFTESIDVYDAIFNGGAVGDVSLKRYFNEVSYGNVNINTTFYPKRIGTQVVSYKDSHPRAYYQKYNASYNKIGYTDSQEWPRRRDLLINAVKFVAASIPKTLEIDSDNNGEVDDICFIASGVPEGWADLLWPHRSSLLYEGVYINNKEVGEYHFQLDGDMDVGVIAHETFHVMGAPDLYDYTRSSVPVGIWDVMANNYSTPQHMSAYMKMKYGGWISSIPEISADGVYSLHPLTASSNNAYLLRSPLKTDEYFVIEYRRSVGIFESSLPGSGLIVYRVNTNIRGNVEGPGEVYVYRPEGTIDSDGDIYSANLSRDYDRDVIGNYSDQIFLSNEADSRLLISEIGTCQSTISFRVTFPVPNDDDFPGLQIKPEILDAVDEFSDPNDVFYLDMVAGNDYIFEMTADSANDFDLYLYDTSYPSIFSATRIAHSNGKTSNELIKYVAYQSGRYFIRVQAYKGAGNYTLSFSSQKTIEVTGIKLNKGALTLKKSQRFQLIKYISPANASDKTVEWFSMHDTIATVSLDGLVTAKGAGTTYVYCFTENSDIFAYCKIVVTQAVTSVKLNKTSITIYRGKSLKLNPTVLPTNATNKKVTWKSSNKRVATVSASGTVKGIQKGTAYVFVYTVDGKKSAMCKVTVK
ncbi:MAG: M6 family metalloprotease domain-containing protein, partial [Clostridia bacterium]